MIELLRRVDRSFAKTGQSFRAENRDAYLVDLVKPLRKHPWRKEKSQIGGQDDLQAAEIMGLAWLESAPAFEQIAIDERGAPVLIVTIDPRVFAVHKYWLASQPGRDPLKKKRDLAQAQAVAHLTMRDLPHLPFDMTELRMIPRDIAQAALDHFATLPQTP